MKCVDLLYTVIYTYTVTVCVNYVLTYVPINLARYN